MMDDKAFVEAFDSALFYGDKVYGAVLFHPADLARYLKALPKKRVRRCGPDESPIAYVAASWTDDAWKSKDVYESEHTSLGMVRYGYGNSSKTVLEVYRPEPETLSAHEFLRRVTAAMKDTYQWTELWLSEADFEVVAGMLSQDETFTQVRSDQPERKFVRAMWGERRVNVADFVIKGTLLTGSSWDQKTHHLYQWTGEILIDSRYERDLQV